MAFIITLYKNSAEPERIDKTVYLATALRLEGTLKEETDISTPSILFEYDGELPAFNYVHIPAFRRYYFLTSLVSVSTKLWRMDLSCDVLQSFQNEIKKNSATLARSENHYNTKIKDSILPFDSNRQYSRIDIVKDEITYYQSVIWPSTNAYLYLLITANGNQIAEQPPHTYPTPLNSANTYYILTATQLRRVIELVWKESVKMGYQFLADSLAEAIVSIKGFPWDLKEIGTVGQHMYATDTIFIGNIPITVPGDLPVYKLSSEYFAHVRFGTFELGNGNSFTDFSPYTSYSLYLPYIGFVDLSPEQYVGRTTHIVYKFDLSTGKTIANLMEFTESTPLSGTILATYSGMLGGNIPISSSGADAFDAQVFRTVTGATFGALTAPLAIGTGGIAPAMAGGMVGSLISAGVNTGLNLERTVRAEGTSTPFIDVHQPTDPYIIRSTAVSAEPANYASLYGRPSMMTMALKDVSGFAMIDRVHLEHLDEATEGEINEIDRLLHSGVIF